MKIAIIGYGKMGRMIEKICLERGHQITARVDIGSGDTFDSTGFTEADVAIEFTTPEAAVGNVSEAILRGIPVVCGTTGWNDAMPEVRDLLERKNGTLLWASNFSIGMNVFMAMNRYLSAIMSRIPGYRPEIEEIHHIHKLDHPSGTAVSLANDLMDAFPGLSGMDVMEESGRGNDTAPGKLPVYYRREGEVAGIHEVTWTSAADRISMRHEAFSREGFALGAVIAAEWIKGKHGFFGMRDILGDIIKN